jgi:hypothetical protein
MNFIPIFLPANIISVFWNTYVIVFQGVFLYIYSIFLFFDDTIHDFSQVILSFAFYTFAIDILFNMNIAFYSKDSLVTSRIKISKRLYYLYIIFFIFI